MYDNASAKMISKNSVLYACTKHIEIRHNVICDDVESNNIELVHIDAIHQITDIFIKP
jgi:hypothetical protein